MWTGGSRDCALGDGCGLLGAASAPGARWWPWWQRVGRRERVRKRLRERLGIDAVVIHWSRHAVGDDLNSAACVEAPYTDNPQISTGAGDHFNAGFCLGLLLGGDLEANIQLGVATSGYYVREAQSPTRATLMEFVEALSRKRF